MLGSSMRRSIVGAVGAGLALTLATSTPSVGAPVVAPAADVVQADPAGKQQATISARAYSPQPGIMFNHPLRKSSHNINRHVRRTIESTPKGAKIRLATWNFKSILYVRALRNAHERGVSVRVLMSNGLAQGQSSTGSYETLKRALAKGNRTRKPGMRSWIRGCKNSCRGREGIAHSKYFIFSEAGRSKKIVISASANLTEVAANNQWNDAFTTVGREKVYEEFLKIFNQSAGDRPRSPAFYMFQDADLRGWFYPRMGRPGLGLKMLRNTSCRGANDGTGVDGRTRLRIAQAVFNGQPGIRAARRIKELHNNGCDVRIVYTMMIREVRNILRGVPSRHIVQDFDGDGSYDRYLHMKAMAISGVYNGDRSARIVLNGSANWSGMAFQSDEQGFVIRRGAAEKKYAAWVNDLFMDPPRSVALRVSPAERKAPYSEVEFD